MRRQLKTTCINVKCQADTEVNGVVPELAMLVRMSPFPTAQRWQARCIKCGQGWTRLVFEE